MSDLHKLPFDQYQRYRLIHDIIKLFRSEIALAEQNQPTLKILDVGGYFLSLSGQEFLPIQAFLPDDQTFALDVACADRLQKYIQGNGLNLPFPNQCFDLVVSCDTLEHIPVKSREQFLDSLLRLSKYGLILAAPFDTYNVVAAERIIIDFSKAKCGLDHPPLQEHVQYGLPVLDKIKDYLQRSDFGVEAIPTGNLTDWLVMMTAKQYALTLPDGAVLNELIDQYYNLTYYNDGQIGRPNYRTILVAAKGKYADNWLHKIAKVFQESIKETPSRSYEGSDKLIWAFQLLDRLSSATERQRYETEQRKWAVQRQKLNAQLQHHSDLLVAAYRTRQRKLFNRLQEWSKETIKMLFRKEYAIDIEGNKVLPLSPLTKGIEYRQKFFAEEDGLFIISILVSTHGRVNTSFLSLKLYDDSFELIAADVLRSVALQDLGWHHFEFASQPNSKGRLYTLVITSPDGVISDTISLLVNPSQSLPGQQLRRNGKRLIGSLVYRLKYE